MQESSSLIRRDVTTQIEDAVASATRQTLNSLGQFVDAEALENTPKRVAEMYSELFEGYWMDPKEILSKGFEEGDDDLVVVRDTEFHSVCQHHLIPFFGRLHLAYIVSEKRVVGLSKVPRLIDCFAHRLQLQERLTRQVANAFVEYVSPDVMVVSDGKSVV